jgi:putative acetyltransferase
MPEVRSAQPADLASVEEVHRAAFPTDLEARLVRLLVERGRNAISLVAVAGDQVVGHVLFSPATIEVEGRVFATGLGLGPIAVLPPFQNRGHGSSLIRMGLEHCRHLNVLFAVVLGEPAYYGRFGFVPASRDGLAGEFGGEDAFQIQWLGVPANLPAGCLVRYAPEFQEIVTAASG